MMIVHQQCFSVMNQAQLSTKYVSKRNLFTNFIINEILYLTALTYIFTLFTYCIQESKILQFRFFFIKKNSI